ncbi:hypothetical protein GCM10023165_02230 [Variovorax defluvii]|uniref:DUF4175 domain-containing protein n=2 Tax=Variovorax defluvii TaxID=913761 RepID=A0ABP8GTF7_9BURK
MTKHRHAFWHLWGWPLSMGVLTAIGLVSALFSDGGLGDAVAWGALGIPVAVCLWYGWRPRKSASGQPH